MKSLMKGFGLSLALLVGLTGLFLAVMRFSDGPFEIFSGGPFTSGELAAAPDDWSFLKDRETVEFQTRH